MLLAVALCFKTEVKSQFNSFTLSKTSTSAGVDTITGNVTYPGSITMSAVVTMTPISGTAGKIVLFGTNNGNTYVRVDSTSINLTGAAGSVAAKTDYLWNHFTNSKLDKPDFWKYRFVWYQTTGSVSAASGTVLTRTGGN